MLTTEKELRGYRYLLAESDDCACLEKRDMRMRKMMGSSWNRAENPPYALYINKKSSKNVPHSFVLIRKTIV
jgi:hypothetical protein